MVKNKAFLNFPRAGKVSIIAAIVAVMLCSKAEQHLSGKCDCGLCEFKGFASKKNILFYFYSSYLELL